MARYLEVEVAGGGPRAQLPAGRAPRHAPQPGGDQQHRHAYQHVGDGLGAAKGLDAVGDGEQPADDEDADSSQQ
jgi:hypothetical protein